MRRSLPYDAAICLCLAALIAWGVGILTGKVAESSWERQKEKLAPESGEVGGIAGKEVFRVETVEDMLSHDTFTIECPYHNFYNDGTGWVNIRRTVRPASASRRAAQESGSVLWWSRSG